MKFPVRKRNRLRSYDYSRDGFYYFTSNAKNNICYFGEVRNQVMHLNEYGQIVLEQWLWLEKQFPYVLCHEFVVMPNHVHGILEIKRDCIRLKEGVLGSCSHEAIKIKPLSELIGAFKMTASKRIGLLVKANISDTPGRPEFQWHRSYHDHIIRSHNAYLRIARYINRNPENWRYDEFNR